ncbi:cytosine deaminase [Leptolyngbya sp. AN02str]|uniref:cytosine deaminase n=1 Tax=Leptolyngbya sp. AN02str TaxID=3423363 RepID=UPI003D321729
MVDFRSVFPASAHYWLKNAHVPVSLLTQPLQAHTRDGLAWVDVEIVDGRIAQIVEAGQTTHAAVDASVPWVDVQQGTLFPGFVDMHTHLDKGHIWERSPNLGGTFEDALNTVRNDSESRWNAEDVYRRMEFGLKCSYAHGTAAIRTHIDSFGKQANISFDVLKTLREEWRDRITLQAVNLVPLEYFLTPEGETLADLVAEVGGILGGVVYMNPELDAQINRVFELAKERQLALDFHTDESGNPDDVTLRHVAAAAVRHQFPHQIVCGHCCSLAVQDISDVQKTIGLVKDAGIGVVSLPMCNMYLQDRNQRTSQNWVMQSGDRLAHLPDQTSYTPRWRGVTLLHELKQAGVPVAIASDNCRDPFHAFGDHDVLEVLTQGIRIAQLDSPYGDWCHVVTQTPADLMGLPEVGRIGVGLLADLVLFRGRYFSELLSRSQHDRLVIRQGQLIDAQVPDYAELDDLVKLT